MNEIRFTSELNGKEVELKLRQENLDIQNRANQQYHITYIQAIRAGIPPRSTLEKLLRENDMWTDEDDQKMNTLRLRVASLEAALEDAKTKADALPIAAELSEKRGELVELTRDYNEVLNNSAEYIAESVRRDAYVAYATVYADTNKPVFKDYAEFIARSDEKIVADIRNTITTALMEDFNRYIDELPEAKFIKDDDTQEADDAKESVATATKTSKKKVVKKTTKKIARKPRQTKKKA